MDGHVLGRHRGIEHYTIGQRRGLGVAVSYPVYVHSIDAKNNLVVLAPSSALDSAGLIADDFVWAGDVVPPVECEPIEAMVKIRLASRPVKAKIRRNNAQGSEWEVMFESPQHAVAPGQSVVLYQDGVIIGGGIISQSLRG